LRGLFPKSRINSMNSHCHEHPDSTLCNWPLNYGEKIINCSIALPQK
jgi:hypothetical protein